jgi:hypothetical protein
MPGMRTERGRWQLRDSKNRSGPAYSHAIKVVAVEAPVVLVEAYGDYSLVPSGRLGLQVRAEEGHLCWYSQSQGRCQQVAPKRHDEAISRNTPN